MRQVAGVLSAGYLLSYFRFNTTNSSFISVMGISLLQLGQYKGKLISVVLG